MSIVWFEGNIYDDEPLSLDPRDRGLLLGDGIFETLLVADHVILWRAEHLMRMEKAAQEISLPFPLKTIEQAVEALAEFAYASHVLRITLTRGAGVRGLAGTGIQPTLLASLDVFESKMLFQPVKLATSSIRRSKTSPAARIKTLSYIDNILAAKEATAKHAEDALLLNTDGYVSGSTIANFFLLKNNQLITPSLDQAILPGIMRQLLLNEASTLGLEPVERAIPPAEVREADAVFLTNSLRFLRPVIELDGVATGNRESGFLSERLRDLAKRQGALSLF